MFVNHWCPLDGPAAVTRLGISGGPYKHPSLNPQLAESIDFLSSLSTSSASSQSSRPTTPCSDDMRTSTDPTYGTSKRQLRKSPSKRILDFCWSLFHYDSNHAYASFLLVYPEYKLTRPIDDLRKREFKRLRDSEEVYMDYVGASLYPESLVRSNSAFLSRTILGNTHSINAR